LQTFPTIERAPGDAAAFIDRVQRVASGLVFRYRPPHVGVVRIRRWFDHRWLGFSGKGRTFFDSPFLADPCVSLAPFRQDQLTFPPFAPTRVVAERHWQRDAHGNYAPSETDLRIHRARRQRSARNLHLRVADLVDSALFLWFSSDSIAIRRASLLVYIVNDGAVLPWLASLRADPRGSDGWSLGEVQGLGRAEVEEFLEHPPLARPAKRGRLG
jgi:hypothetical protein